MINKPSHKAERRSVPGIAARSADDGATTLVGYAAVFGEPADIAGIFDEIIAPGAFTKALTSSDVLAYHSHDSGRVLGRISSGTLRLAEDERGLAVEIDLPDTSDGHDAKTSVARGDIKGMSFGFRVPPGGDKWDFSGSKPVRTIYSVDLEEVSIVARPAYEGTEVALRSLDEARSVARRQHNFAAASRRVGMKMTFDLKKRPKSKA